MTEWPSTGVLLCPRWPCPRRSAIAQETAYVINPECAYPVLAEVHEIDGAGYWAEVPRFPGCVAQAETIEALRENLLQAVEDWLYGQPVKTEGEARKAAQIQGSSQPVDESFPQPYNYRPPPSWTDEDE